ncbi:serine/threonine protein kinase [Actinoallomurus sp. NBC_01490]|uniref:serine/threonine-protein kinase n=1 Tax=Actinoallomurus sp. NBC_01490 TaxID=2903557 RepID=UPI002E3582CB|nr:serine/threonine-protein kinase [Actinoallomurus sp. NBC_01490]
MRRRSNIEPGLELGGRYRVEERIGAGGMGDVWRGVDLRLRRPVAIKVLPAELATDESAVERFRREAETTAALQHPGITVTFDIDEHRDGQDRLIFLVMELLTGRDLGTVLAREPRGVPIELAVSLTAQAADALAAAHSRGIVHRDIKPANLFLLDDGRVKLCDFGIARLSDSTQLTASGSYIGTPLYMAPEQFRGERLDARSDLYSLGCVLYELLVGSPPFDSGENPAAIMYRHLNETPAPPRSRRPDVPDHLDRLTLDLLAKDPAARPQSAPAVVAALRGQAAGPRSPAAPATTADWAPNHRFPSDATTRQDAPPATVGNSRPKRGRRVGLVVGVGAAVVALAAGTAVALTWDGKPPPKPGPTPTRSAASRTPRAETGPLIAGWKTTVAPQYGIAYDAPPTWTVKTPGYVVYFPDANSNILAAEKGVAEVDRGKCTSVVAGVRGGVLSTQKPSKTQLGTLQYAAADEARKWANAAYGGSGAHPRPPTVSTGQGGSITLNGVDAAYTTVAVTTAAGGDACTPPHAMVETVAMASVPGSSTGPVFFTVFADRGISGQVSDEEIKKVIGTIRPYTCPSGQKPQDDNRCH